MEILIIDYQCGNLGSIQNMISKIGHRGILTSDPEAVMKAEKIILPGVGSFDFGMNQLDTLDLTSALNEKMKAGTPILGVCLGAQLMCNQSEEGQLFGLSWVDAKVQRFPKEVEKRKQTVPHMGWDHVSNTKQSKLFSSISEARFYFVHSYYIQCSNAEDVLCKNNYGVSYHSAFEINNVLGVQFHPEKSHDFGKQLYKNFIELY